MATRLTAEQRAELQRQLDDDAAADDDFEVEIEDGGKRARVPYSKARKWLGDTFGIDLDDTSQDDETEDKPAGKAKDSDTVRRFGGRRVS
jgi:hypothetical protein